MILRIVKSFAQSLIDSQGMESIPCLFILSSKTHTLYDAVYLPGALPEFYLALPETNCIVLLFPHQIIIHIWKCHQCLETISFLVVFFFSLFILREREHACEWESSREKGRERIPSRFRTVSTEPDPRLVPTN